MLRSIIFLKQSQISDYARMRLAALKIYGIPVRVFTEPISGLPHRLSGKPLIPASGRRARCHSSAFPDAGYSIEKQVECVGLQATITDVVVRVQMLDGSYGMPGTTWVFAENTSVIRLIMSILAWVSS
jgi:hypothetical protein